MRQKSDEAEKSEATKTGRWVDRTGWFGRHRQAQGMIVWEHVVTGSGQQGHTRGGSREGRRRVGRTPQGVAMVQSPESRATVGRVHLSDKSQSALCNPSVPMRHPPARQPHALPCGAI